MAAARVISRVFNQKKVISRLQLVSAVTFLNQTAKGILTGSVSPVPCTEAHAANRGVS
jgi:hypothetical protein